MQDAINALGGADIRRTYMTIGKGGTFRLEVPEGTAGSQARTYEVEVDGVKTTRTKIEINKSKLESVMIKSIGIYDGKFGESVNVSVDIKGFEFTIQIKADSSYGMDFMEKIPNVNLYEPVTLIGYDFEDDKGKNRRGLSIYQDGEKIQGFFYDVESKKALHGIPTAGSDMDKKKWRRFFEDKAEFLTAYMKSHIIPQLASSLKTVDDIVEQDSLDINPEDVPF